MIALFTTLGVLGLSSLVIALLCYLMVFHGPGGDEGKVVPGAIMILSLMFAGVVAIVVLVSWAVFAVL